jgi:hypothetical protein
MVILNIFYQWNDLCTENGWERRKNESTTTESDAGERDVTIRMAKR